MEKGRLDQAWNAAANIRAGKPFENTTKGRQPRRRRLERRRYARRGEGLANAHPD